MSGKPHNRKENQKFESSIWKKQMFYPPLRDKFTKFGDKFEKIDHNEVNGMYCYKRTTSEGLTYYEAFKALIQEGIPRYPKSSEFGFGRALCIRGDES